MAWETVSYQTESGRQPVNEFIAGLPSKDKARIYWALDPG